MATIIVLSDIHGNLAALQAVWRDIGARNFDALYCLGDLAAFGPEPDECITFLRETVQPTVTIAGNTDRYLVEQTWKKADDEPMQQALRWARERISDANMKWLKGLPAGEKVTVEGLDVELAHGAPGDDEFGIGRECDREKLAAVFKKHGAGVTFCGHTHVPWRGRVGVRDVVNVGSVGFPLDGDRRASYFRAVLHGGQMFEIETRRVSYNTDAVVARIEAAAMPWSSTLSKRLRFAELP